MVLLGDIMSMLGDIVRTSEATTIHVVGYDEHILRCSVYWGGRMNISRLLISQVFNRNS